MGFFDKILNTISSEIDKNVRNGINSILDKNEGDNDTKPVANNSNAYNNQQTVSNQNSYNDERTAALDKFDKILGSYFSQYSIKKDVKSSTLGAADDAYDYTYGLYKDNSLKLVIIISGHNKANNRHYFAAREAAINNGIAFLNFFSNFENKQDYVIDRINKSL